MCAEKEKVSYTLKVRLIHRHSVAFNFQTNETTEEEKLRLSSLTMFELIKNLI